MHGRALASSFQSSLDNQEIPEHLSKEKRRHGKNTWEKVLGLTLIVIISVAIAYLVLDQYSSVFIRAVNSKPNYYEYEFLPFSDELNRRRFVSLAAKSFLGVSILPWASHRSLRGAGLGLNRPLNHAPKARMPIYLYMSGRNDSLGHIRS